jgi:hypothetical protein
MAWENEIIMAEVLSTQLQEFLVLDQDYFSRLEAKHSALSSALTSANKASLSAAVKKLSQLQTKSAVEQGDLKAYQETLSLLSKGQKAVLPELSYRLTQTPESAAVLLVKALQAKVDRESLWTLFKLEAAAFRKRRMIQFTKIGFKLALAASSRYSLRSCLQKWRNSNIRSFTVSRISYEAETPSIDISCLSPSRYQHAYNTYERQVVKNKVCVVLINHCKVSVEQTALWRWFLLVQDYKNREKAFELALRKLKSVSRVIEMQLAFYRWAQLASALRRKELSIVSDREAVAEYSDLSARSKSAYLVFLHRHMKLNVVRTLVNYCRVNTEQIALWRWKFHSDDVTQALQKRALKRCGQLALKGKMHRYLSRWNTRTKLCQSFMNSRSMLSIDVPDFTLREVFVKARIRWYYCLKEKFAKFKGKQGGLSLITPRTLLHQLQDTHRSRLSKLVKRMQFVQKQRSSLEFKGLLKWEVNSR